MKQTKKAIAYQWQELLDSGRVPVLLFKRNNSEYLCCWINHVEDGSQSYFHCEFSEGIGYVDGLSKNNLHIDQCSDIDHYMQVIHDKVYTHLLSKKL